MAAPESDEWAPKPCAGLGDLFFSEDPKEIEAAKSICNDGCTHGVACVELALQALADGETHGVWAGMTLVEIKEGLANADRNRARAAGHPSSTGHGDAVPDLCDGPSDEGGHVRELPGSADAAPGS